MKDLKNYAKAKESEHSLTHEQDTCVPITFINDTMINLVKQQDNSSVKKPVLVQTSAAPVFNVKII